MKFATSKPNSVNTDFEQPLGLPGWIPLLGAVLTLMGMKAQARNTTTLTENAVAIGGARSDRTAHRADVVGADGPMLVKPTEMTGRNGANSGLGGTGDTGRTGATSADASNIPVANLGAIIGGAGDTGGLGGNQDNFSISSQFSIYCDLFEVLSMVEHWIAKFVKGLAFDLIGWRSIDRSDVWPMEADAHNCADRCGYIIGLPSSTVMGISQMLRMLMSRSRCLSSLRL